jgi:hypothetical protein
MKLRALPAAFAILVTSFAVSIAADPLHSRPDGTYWHHDSGWLFPERIGGFTRVGAPQDVAGSPDAVAHYALTINGSRILATVDVLAADSAAEDSTLPAARSRLITGKPDVTLEDAGMVVGTRPLAAARVLARRADTAIQALYFVDAGAWRVRIRIEIPRDAGDASAELDAFVRAQRWETLP